MQPVTKGDAELVTDSSCWDADAQVRDFTFSPDSGRITHLSYDTFGLPTIPETLLNVYEVDAEAVLEVRSGLVVLKRGAERAVVLVSTGLLGYALEKAKVRPRPCLQPSQLSLRCA